MSRWIARIFMLSSLLLFAATIALWVRMARWQDGWIRTNYEPSQSARRDIEILTSGGTIRVGFYHQTVAPIWLLYNREDQHLQSAGDITLPWVHARQNYKSLVFDSDPDKFREKFGLFWHRGQWANAYTSPTGIKVGIRSNDTKIYVRCWLLCLISLAYPGARAIGFVTRKVRSSRRQAARSDGETIADVR